MALGWSPNSLDDTPSPACSWNEFRFNIVPFGVQGHRMRSEFRDTLHEALAVRIDMTARGAEDVRVYDTVDNKFY